MEICGRDLIHSETVLGLGGNSSTDIILFESWGNGTQRVKLCGATIIDAFLSV